MINEEPINEEPKDKCQICGFEGYSSEFGDDEGVCPNCGSNDVDDAETNPYEEDDLEDGLW